MAQIRFYTDEDIYGAIAIALRNSDFDAVSTPDIERLGQSDESQLEWATAEGRSFVTFNVAHFAQLHAEWVSQGRQHSGIIVSIQRPIGDLLKRLLNLGSTLDTEAMQNRLEFLSDW